MYAFPLNTVANATKPMFISHKIGVKYDEYDNEIPVYDKPIFYKNVIYMHLVGNDLEAYKQLYGETSSSVIRCFVDYQDTDLFHEYDIAYLYGAKPDNEEIYGDNANYTIRAVKPQNSKTMILLEEIVKEK